MNFNCLLNKSFFSLTSSYGFEFGKKYKIAKIEGVERYREKAINDYSIIVMENGQRFFTCDFLRTFTDDKSKLLGELRDRIIWEAKTLNKLTPTYDRLSKEIKESKNKIETLINLHRDITLNRV